MKGDSKIYLFSGNMFEPKRKGGDMDLSTFIGFEDLTK